MRVVVSFLSDASLSDGCVGHTSALVREFEAHGCEVYLVCLSSSGENAVGGHLQYAAVPSLYGMAKAAARSVAFARRVRADMLVCTSLGAPFNPLIAVVAKVLGIPVVYDCQDPPIETMPLIFGTSPRARLLSAWVWAADWLLRSSTAWAFTVSDGVEALLRRHGWRMPIFRFYNNHSARVAQCATARKGVRAQLGWQNATVLFYAGGLQPGLRGIELQLHAVALARRNGKNVKFLAFGTGNVEHFVDLARSLQIEDHVRFCAPLPRSQLFEELRDADAAVMSTVPFALPSKVFEYVACGLRVLCDRRNKDIAEAFGEYVVTFDGTPSGLADALARFEQTRPAVEPAAILAPFSQVNSASVTAVCDALRAQHYRT